MEKYHNILWYVFSGSPEISQGTKWKDRQSKICKKNIIILTSVLFRQIFTLKKNLGNSMSVDELREVAGKIPVKDSGRQERPLDIDFLQRIIDYAVQGLAEVDGQRILRETLRSLYKGISASELHTALLISGRTLVEQEPNYSYVTARLLLYKLWAEDIAKGYDLEHTDLSDESTLSQMYRQVFLAYIPKGIAADLLDPNMGRTFDMEALAQALEPQRDLQFQYLGLQTLYDRYFLHRDEVRLELPQVFFMRVAMGLALTEDRPTERAIEFYRLISGFDYMTATPTLFNAGTLRSQLSSCYLTTVPDDLDGIFNAIHDNAMLSKWAGGLGNDWTPVRAMGSHIKGTNGKSQGVVPFLKVVNDTAVAVNQGGKRKGAVCSYLEAWHFDIEEFVELRKNTGDDRRRTHDMNTAIWVPDLLVRRVQEDGSWLLFSPSNVPDLHDLYGQAFEQRYAEYEKLAAEGKLRHKKLAAVTLWRKILSMLFETGHPWVTFKDPCNLRSPQQHVGRVHSSNLCTEITLNTSAEEIAVCNLGSINLASHVTDGQLQQDKLRRTVRTAIRMLDNVIDINYYAVEKARRSNLRHRPVGLGMMGFQDALYKLGIAFSSEEAVQFADSSTELISYYAIEASQQLAQERGSYESFAGSLWSQGILPIDSIELLARSRGEGYLELDRSQSLDWSELREKVRGGMRNSNVLAIAPTATISNIVGVSQSIEPTFQNVYVKSNLSGEFTVINRYLVDELKAMGLWDQTMIEELKRFDGSVQDITRVPDKLKQRYRTAFELEPRWVIETAARRQKWIDQAQSLNIYMGAANGKKIDLTYRMAWLRGLKTTYYLRALAATATEKSTVSSDKLNAVRAEAEH
ncbi:ribonucleoside-diphosphate reductase subunit alpha [Candidatus Haliotispira prima]|uniref:Ribonucleoside-diphosphate reductase n=2 Tax=Candidatus Haliotispira prima TaxID=3034016 RepID=A0ABY8MGH7_9SPIO|nr:ribonucleoside-diphosphate reductase subunit alpha [Candidatus Haliotispira prima]